MWNEQSRLMPPPNQKRLRIRQFPMPPLRSVKQAITAWHPLDRAAPAAIPVEQAGDLVRQRLYYPLPMFRRRQQPTARRPRDVRGAELLPHAQAASLGFIEDLPSKSMPGAIMVP
jgi:hypothetical protein